MNRYPEVSVSNFNPGMVEVIVGDLFSASEKARTKANPSRFGLSVPQTGMDLELVRVFPGDVKTLISRVNIEQITNRYNGGSTYVFGLSERTFGLRGNRKQQVVDPMLLRDVLDVEPVNDPVENQYGTHNKQIWIIEHSRKHPELYVVSRRVVDENGLEYANRIDLARVQQFPEKHIINYFALLSEVA